MRALANFSLKNTLLVNLAFVFVILAGYTALKSMQREAFPNISFDVVVVSTYYPGATPEEIEKLITIPIEKELKEVEDIDEIISVSTEGISVITVQLEENVPDKNRVINDIQRAVDRTDDLPDDLQDKPLVKDIKTKNRPIIEVSLSGNLPETELRKYAKTLEKKLIDLNDVARIEYKGLRNLEIWVEVSPSTLDKNHMSIDEIANALALQNRTVPGGKYYVNGLEHLLRTTGEFHNTEEIKKTIVRASPLGGWINIDEIAEVKEAFEEETVINRTLGTRSINLVVIKKEKGDAIDLVDDIKDICTTFKKTADPNLNISYVNDMSFFIKRRLNVLINNGLLGMAMVIIALFTFLSFRTAIAACIGIPTALFLTFAGMYAFGITFNMISMFGLIMVLGMLVDEDIVISENIFRHLENKEPIDKATINGVGEVAWPLIATVLTTVAAFTPLLVMGGIMGRFIRNIPIVVTLTLVASLFQAMVILPSHIWHFNTGRFAPKLNKVRKRAHMEKLAASYKKLLTSIIKRRYVILGLLILLSAATGILAKTHLKFILFPTKGIEILHVKIEGELGDSLTVMSKKIALIEKLVANLKPEELDNYVTNVGQIMRDRHDVENKTLTHVGQIIIYLTPEDDRDRNSQEIIDDLRSKATHLKGFTRLDFEKVRMGPPVGKPIQIRVRGDNLAKGNKIANEFVKVLSQIDGVNDIKSDYDMAKDEYRIVVDPVKTAQAGLTVTDVAMAVRNAFDGNIATKIKTSEEEINVVVKFPEDMRQDPTALGSLLIPNKNGNHIKISQIANFATHKSLLAIKHHDAIRTINITTNIDEKKTSALKVSNMMKALILKIEKENPGFTITFGGEVEETQESLDNMFRAFYLAAVLILIILIAMLRSLTQPLVIMSTIPFAIVGVVLAFFLHGEPFSFMSLMGMIGMTGVIVDSGIIMIDFMNKLREKGMNTRESIVEGSVIRLRAIILTTLTTFFGIIPAAYGLGGSDPFIRPMALALNYGIVAGALVNIFFLPPFMAILEDVKDKAKNIFDRVRV